ncbi:hypothetical protein [Bacillus manliponensis]|uniref:hypothetical protein n=1 Tax=Bacillus manliponensis TaxID=574376 RepID=UPI00190F6B5E|nr:hypothetical protein [Bacillus manliponensis]
MIANLGILLLGGLVTGIGSYFGKKYLGPSIDSLYKKAKTTLLRGKDKGGSQKNKH